MSSIALPPLWPSAFDAEWSVCCEHWIDTWHPHWIDHQIVSYDYASRRQTVLHTDMYGMGPGRDWTLPSGSVVFQSDNSTDRFQSQCCVKFANLGVVTPDWARRDTPKYLGTEVINVTSAFPGPSRRTAHKWSNTGSGGPSDTNYYWQLGNLSNPMSASLTAQFGASEYLPPPDGNPNISAGYFIVTRPIRARPQNTTLLTAPAECILAAENNVVCPTPQGMPSTVDDTVRIRKRNDRTRTEPPSADSDLVASLPGYTGALPSKHYSGFLDAGSPSSKVHYYLVESESEAARLSPLIVWFNGGPPCAATIGAFSELGPFRTDGYRATGNITLNPTRWSRNASLLFIEAPLGIGFSYSTSSSHDYSAADDNTMAATCLAALLAFYAKFPIYHTAQSSELFVAGESYGGIYVPMLAKAIVLHNDKLLKKLKLISKIASVSDDVVATKATSIPIPLVGILVGNGAIATGDWYEGWLTGLRTANAFAKGLYSPTLREQIVKVCTNFTKGHVSAPCTALLARAATESGNLNGYDLRETCQAAPQRVADRYGDFRYVLTALLLLYLLGTCTDLLTTSTSFLYSLTLLPCFSVTRDAQQPLRVSGAEDPCDLGGSDLIAWMQERTVQAALHVEAAAKNAPSGTNWLDCGGSFGHPVKYTRIQQDERVNVYPSLLGKIRILIFNGDQDNCIPYTQDEAWTRGLGLATSSSWRPWLLNEMTASDPHVGTVQPNTTATTLITVGGYKIEYEQRLTFATVKGAGHLCPRTKGQRIYALMQRFVNGEINP